LIKLFLVKLSNCSSKFLNKLSNLSIEYSFLFADKCDRIILSATEVPSLLSEEIAMVLIFLAFFFINPVLSLKKK
jgi:hypothetical protein